ncbi:hypothetical protein [Acanthamoeba polyphaga mimivirus]|uniref:Ankyrin repeat protein n=2 Tax=Megamimivirinae TaxID=3044648 RepID=A0A2L2DJS2_MIMIV|nr:hypothetical protein LBA_00717 [Megavirus lba]AVG46411.1 hypothetical protein [Acanthamoeba polyphaga mimivirus]
MNQKYILINYEELSIGINYKEICDEHKNEINHMEICNKRKNCSIISSGYFLHNFDEINKHYSSGKYLYIINVNIDDPEIILYKNKDYIQCNKIYVEEKYSLLDPDTYIKFNLNIEDNEYIIDWCSVFGTISELNNLWDLGINFTYTNNSLDYTENVDVLNWWLNSGLELKYTNIAMNLARDTKILQWWLDSGLKLIYNEKAMDSASTNLHIKEPIKILDWWLNSGLELKYTHIAMDNASNIKILDWWLNSGLELKYTINAIEISIITQDTDFLDWWLNSELEIKYDKSRIIYQNDIIIVGGIIEQNATKIINHCKKIGLIE